MNVSQHLLDHIHDGKVKTVTMHFKTWHEFM